jgi:hypothetical protein
MVFDIPFTGIASDAEGVARFVVGNHHSSYILDDWTFKNINNRRNSTSIRSISLGAPCDVKTNGGTMTVKSMWLAITSNDQMFLDFDNKHATDDEVAHMNAWYRRFVFVIMEEPIDRSIDVMMDSKLYSMRLLHYFSTIDFEGCAWKKDQMSNSYLNWIKNRILVRYFEDPESFEM